MKIEVKQAHCVFGWSWNIPKSFTNEADLEDGKGQNWETLNHGQSDDEDDVCGICRASFNKTCPNCKFPGDGCPLVIGQCHHNFHVHCIYEWLDTSTSKGLCPMCRQLFQLDRAISINDSQFTKFEELVARRQREQQDEFEANLDDDAALARVLANREGGADDDDDNQSDVIMDHDLVVR